MYGIMQSEKAPEFRKDTVYHLKNSTHIDWKRFTTLLSSRIISDTIEPLTSEDRRNAFIVDDPIFERKGSQKVEPLAKELGLDVVAMVKKSSKIHYHFQGKMCSCKDIFRGCKHRRGRSRYLLSVPVEICGGDEDAAAIPTKLVFVRNRSNRKDYLVLLSTDTSLTEDEVIQLYGKRWDIEVFFKTCKSVLRLTKECRSLSYDAMCAQTAIVFTRYLFLAVGAREDSDLRTSGPLFCLAADELADVSLAAAFEKLQLFLQKLLEGSITQKEEISALVMDLLAGLPADMKRFLDFEGLMGTSVPEMGCEV